MTEDMMNGIAELLTKLGYREVRAEAGVVHYAEQDGTRHYLIEHDEAEGTGA